MCTRYQHKAVRRRLEIIALYTKYFVFVHFNQTWEKNSGRKNVLLRPHVYVYVIGVTMWVLVGGLIMCCNLATTAIFL